MENPFELILKRLDDLEDILREMAVSTAAGKKAQIQKEVMNITQLAEYLKCSKSILYKKVSGKTVPYFKLGKRVYFRKLEIDNWINGLKV